MLDWNKYPAILTLSLAGEPPVNSVTEIDSRSLSLLSDAALSVFALRCAKRVMSLITDVDNDHVAAVASSVAFTQHKILRARTTFPSDATKKLSNYDGSNEPTRYAIEAVLAAVYCAEYGGMHYAIAAARAAHDAWLSFSKVELDAIDTYHWNDLRQLRQYKAESFAKSLPFPRDLVEEMPSLPGTSESESSAPVGTVTGVSYISEILPRSEFGLLPSLGYLALSARQAIQLVELVPTEYRRAAFEILLAMQEVAGHALGDPLLPLAESLCGIAARIPLSDGSRARMPSEAAAMALYALGRCTRCIWADDSLAAQSFARTALAWSEFAIRQSGKDMLPELQHDVSAIFAYTDEHRSDFQKAMSHLRRGRFPQDIFAQFVRFDTDIEIAGHTILQLSPVISDELVARLSEHPRLIHELQPNEFEELIARVFNTYGFEVELTRPTRDGGRDIIAIAHEPARVKYLIECKKYAPENKVGIAIVQRLHGVLQGDSGSKAIVATTSGFTNPAVEFMTRPHVRYHLEGRDFDGVHRWLVAADRLRMARKAFGASFTINAAGIVVPS